MVIEQREEKREIEQREERELRESVPPYIHRVKRLSIEPYKGLRPRGVFEPPSPYKIGL